ncbi:MAG: ABC transporter permease [Rhodospirillaceae bacterium]|nr:ABC transporter permease [Rhodospirillaceae bacterium]
MTDGAEIIVILAATLRAGTPLILAALGELVTEKSGVLNLGVEGMMLVGAVCAIIVTLGTGSYPLGVLAGILAGTAMALVFGVLTLSLRANQVAAGLALTIFGIGLSAFLGLGYRDRPLDGLKPIHIPWLSDLPIVGKLVFGHDVIVYGSALVFVAVLWFLRRTRAGLVLRAIGEAPEAAHALGHPVLAVRYAATAFGGAMAGLAGAYLTLAYTPMWADHMTAGRGWIALALVVFATWNPWRVLLGAYLFGGVTIAQLHLQAHGVAVSSHILSMLPYVATILVLVVISRDATRIKLNAPAALGKPFDPGR